MSQIIEALGVKIRVGSELEQWRAETLAKKEPETIAWLDHFAAKSRCMLDIGANVGLYSLYAASKSRTLEIIAVEPVRSNYAALIANVELNAAGNITPLHLALTDCCKFSTMHLSDERVGNSGAQLHQPIDEKGQTFQAKRVEKILSFDLDFLVANMRIPFPNIIKIDVDGHEDAILSGMRDMARKTELVSVLVELNSDAHIATATEFMGLSGLAPDDRFNKLENHSSARRAAKGGAARNVVFSRI